MSLSRERIVAAKARADAATVGPWWQEGRDIFSERIPSATSHDIAAYVWSDEDAEFITASREDVPVMADALLRVLDLHAPEEVTVLAQSASPGYEGWPLADVDVCSLCLPDHMRERIEDEEADESDVRPFLHPCATVRAVTGDNIGP